MTVDCGGMIVVVGATSTIVTAAGVIVLVEATMVVVSVFR